MGESCFIVPCVKNSKNEDVPSKLFEDLWKTSGSYKWAEKQYKIATSEEFLSSADLSYAVMDKNGQISAKSFMDITGITFTSDEIKKKLDSQWGDKSLPAGEVSDRVSRFNAEEELKSDFVPVVNNDEREVVEFTIAPRTEDRTAALQAYLENNQIIKALTNRLKALGVEYDFVGTQKYNGRFSTRNAQKAADGYYHLIQLANGIDVEDVLIEESAHLATLACQNSTFINRLLDAINENTIRQLFTKEEIARAELNTKEGKLELAGILVAKAMRNELEGNYKGFLSRVKQAIYKIFSKGDLQAFFSDRRQARMMAQALAHGFLYDSNFDINTALKTPAELYSTSYISKENEVLRSVMNATRKIAAKVDNFSSSTYRDIYKKIISPDAKTDDDLAILAETETVAITENAITTLVNRLGNLTDELTAGGITERFFDEEINVSVLNDVFEASELIETLKDIKKVFDKYIKDSSADPTFTSTVKGLLDQIQDKLQKVEGGINDYITWYSIALLRESIGREQIDLAADVVFRRREDGNFFEKHIGTSIARKDRYYTVSELATTNIEELSDTNSFVTFFRTYSNHRDITTQVFYDIIRKQRAADAINYNKEIGELIDLESDWKKFISNRGIRQIIREYGFDPDTIFYERTKEGKLTGNFIGDIKNGQVKADWRKALKQVKDDFKRALEEGTLKTGDGKTIGMSDYKRLTRSQRYSAFEDYRDSHPAIEEFEEKVYKDKEAVNPFEKYKSDYINFDFIELCEKLPELKELYDRVIRYKNSIDLKYLSVGNGGASHGVNGRVPQFKAKFISRVANRLRERRDLSDPSDLAAYCEDVTSENFGSPITEPIIITEESGSRKKIELDKLPLYGINLLENMDDLSTDIFGSLSKYTEMACRYNTSQAVVSKLELFDKQLSRRDADEDLKNSKRGEKVGDAKNVSQKARNRLMNQLIYVNRKVPFWQRLLSPLGAFGAIRALCFSAVAGLKNYFAGLRVFYQDVLAGVVDGVTFKDVLRQTFINLHPKHFAGEVARVISGNTMTWDQYQGLVDRWDSYRTPSKITRKRGFFSLQTITNIMMANYSFTDNSLIGIIYYSMLGAHKVYDAESGKMIKATDVYKFNKNGTSDIRMGVLRSREDADHYYHLRDARRKLGELIEYNSNIPEDSDEEPYRLSDPASGLEELEIYYRDVLGDKAADRLDSLIREEDGTYKSPKEVYKALTDLILEISYNKDDEYKNCNKINDYIISSQGVYGMLNATAFQSNIYTQSLGKIKGYLFGYIQRNLLSNYSVSSGQYKHSMLDAYRLALFSVFSHKNLIETDDISGGKYIGYTLCLMTLPFAMKNKNLVQHMRACGWDPDQLKKVADMCIGSWINFLLGVLARSLYRGNEKQVGEKVYKDKGKTRLKYSKTGLELCWPFLGRVPKVITPGIFFPESGKTIDYAKANKQLKDWSKPTRKVRYPKNINDYSKGAFEYGSPEYYDRVASYELRNTIYNTDDPLYYITGAMYRLARGVRDEGITLMNPIRLADDLMDLGDYSGSIMFSSGLKTLMEGITAITSGGEKGEKFLNREVRFWLSKFGLTYDGNPAEGDYEVVPIDWYSKQETIDRYRKQNEKLPTFEQ